MRINWSVFLFAVLAVSLVTQPAAAQDPWAFAFAETACNGSQVVLSVSLNVFGEVPADIVGWVVDREVLGACVPPIQVGEARALPVGEQQFTVSDFPEIPDRKAIYYIRAVNAAGGRFPIYWNQRTQFAQADCVGGPAARGTVVELYPGNYWLDVCPEQCWWQLSMFDNSLPPGAENLAGEVIDVFGIINAGLEGPYVSVSGWQVVTDGCRKGVPIGERSWSGIKAQYR